MTPPPQQWAPAGTCRQKCGPSISTLDAQRRRARPASWSGVATPGTFWPVKWVRALVEFLIFN